MSRTPPFPARRPSVTNGVSYTPSSAPGTSTTRPLQISRTGPRPTSPGINNNTSPSYLPPNTAPLGPSRPRRSELRARVEPERASISSDPYRDSDRDSTSTSRSDYPSTSYRVPPKSANNMSTTMGSRSEQQSFDGDQIISPSLSSSFSAFRTAGSSKGQNPDEVADYNYQRDRELEIEAEKARQQRIRDKGLAKGNARRGEIDGMLLFWNLIAICDYLNNSC
jgi:exocyst complex component 4